MHLILLSLGSQRFFSGARCLPSSIIVVSLLAALSEVNHPTYTCQYMVCMTKIEGKYLVTNIIPVNDTENDVGHVCARVIALDGHKCKLFGLELPSIWTTNRHSNVMPSYG